MLPGRAEEAMEAMERKLIHFWGWGISGLLGGILGGVRRYVFLSLS